MVKNPSADDDVLKKLRDIGEIKSLLPMKLYTDSYDATLDKLFTEIIEAGIIAYSYEIKFNQSSNAGNFLKKDDNYYSILKDHWVRLGRAIREIFSS